MTALGAAEPRRWATIMIRTSYRAADELDLKAMGRSRGSIISNLFTVSLPLCALLFAGVYVLSRSIVAAGLISGGFLVASAVSNIRFFKEIKMRQRLLENAQAVEVIEVEVSRVLDIEPLGDNGPALCFFTAGDKALLLVGQWLMEQNSFPSTAFRLGRWSDTKKPIRIESTGAEIIPEHSTVQLHADYKIGDVELFDASPETLQQDFERAFGHRAA